MNDWWIICITDFSLLFCCNLFQNEEVLKRCVQDYQSKLKKSEEKLQAVLQQAEDKLDL